MEFVTWGETNKQQLYVQNSWQLARSTARVGDGAVPLALVATLIADSGRVAEIARRIMPVRVCRHLVAQARQDISRASRHCSLLLQCIVH